MSNIWQWTIGILIITGVIAYTQPGLIDEVKQKVKTFSIEPKSENERFCLNQISKGIENIRKRAPSSYKIELVESESFNNKERAINYISSWRSTTMFEDETAKDVNDFPSNGEIFIGIIKIEGIEFLTQSEVVLTTPITCINNTLLTQSKKELYLD